MRSHKYRAVATEVDGIRFASKLEAKVYRELRLRRDAEGGDVAYFLRQVPLHLPGGVKLVVDFVAFMRDGSVAYIEAKGVETQAFRAKRRIAEAIYPIQLQMRTS